MYIINYKWRTGELNKKITLSLRSLITSILVLVLFLIMVFYFAVFQLGVLDKTENNDDPNTENIHEKSNKVVISNIKPRRE